MHTYFTVQDACTNFARRHLSSIFDIRAVVHLGLSYWVSLGSFYFFFEQAKLYRCAAMQCKKSCASRHVWWCKHYGLGCFSASGSGLPSWSQSWISHCTTWGEWEDSSQKAEAELQVDPSKTQSFKTPKDTMSYQNL